MGKRIYNRKTPNSGAKARTRRENIGRDPGSEGGGGGGGCEHYLGVWAGRWQNCMGDRPVRQDSDMEYHWDTGGPEWFSMDTHKKLHNRDHTRWKENL
jgi:hypothetical protein